MCYPLAHSIVCLDPHNMSFAPAEPKELMKSMLHSLMLMDGKRVPEQMCGVIFALLDVPSWSMRLINWTHFYTTDCLDHIQRCHLITGFQSNETDS